MYLLSVYLDMSAGMPFTCHVYVYIYLCLCIYVCIFIYILMQRVFTCFFAV